MKEQKKSQFNVAIVLTIIRLLLAPFIFLSLVLGKLNVGILLFIFAGLTDILDGYLARRYGLTTRLGTILDPLADKAIVNATAAALVLMTGFPLPAFLIFLTRDLLIIIGGYTMLKRRMHLVSPTRLSKLTTFFQICSVVGFFLRIAFIPLLAIAIMLTIFSGIDYAYRVYSRNKRNLKC